MWDVIFHNKVDLNSGMTSLVGQTVKNLPAGEWNGHPLQYSYLENSMDIGPWRATVLGVTKNQTQLSN